MNLPPLPAVPHLMFNNMGGIAIAVMAILLAAWVLFQIFKWLCRKWCNMKDYHQTRDNPPAVFVDLKLDKLDVANSIDPPSYIGRVVEHTLKDFDFDKDFDSMSVYLQILDKFAPDDDKVAPGEVSHTVKP